MGEGELKFPEWQTPLQELILEFDSGKLPKKLQEVETLILERLERLSQSEDGRGERYALDDALSILRVIRRDRLDFRDRKAD
jgi:hypothetical protein